MLINVIGLGYIGLPTSLMLAARNNRVIGSDINQDLVSELNKGNISFEENGLFDLYKKARVNEIRFSTDYSSDADIYIITVPTPYDSKTKKIDPGYLVEATKNIISTSTQDSIIVVESTVSPGTINEYIRPLVEKSKYKHDLVHAPERILPGSMIEELVKNPRTIGADDERVGRIIANLYSSFCEAKISLTSIEVAEMSKVIENTYRDVNIAFANELAQICYKANLNVNEVIKIANQHPRVNILSPGPGVGGHCISVDPWFLVGDYPNDTKLIKQARNVNNKMPSYILNRLLEIMKNRGVRDFRKVGVYGITYKENVDDIRESPTLQFETLLRNEQKNIKFYDPMLKNKVLNNQIDNFDTFMSEIEILVIFVAHKQLKKIKIDDRLIVFDTKNVLNIPNAIKL